MKKIVLILLACTPLLMSANIITPRAFISEIYFGNSNEWTLELNMEDLLLYYQDVDSLTFTCNAGTAKINMPDNPGQYVVITSSDLDTPLTINKDADHIILTTHFEFNTGFEDEILIGSTGGSFLHNIEIGQSIACISMNEFFSSFFYKDNTPTIGSPNDLEGSLGKIYGHIYDSTGQVLTNKKFTIGCGYTGWIEVNENGYFETQIASRYYYIKTLNLLDNQSKSIALSSPVSFEINENDSINIDINFETNKINPFQTVNTTLTNYPNPANNYTQFVFDIADQNYQNLEISIYNIAGQCVDKIYKVLNQYKYNCSHLKSGTYIYTISRDGNVLNSQKLHVIHD